MSDIVEVQTAYTPCRRISAGMKDIVLAIWMPRIYPIVFNSFFLFSERIPEQALPVFQGFLKGSQNDRKPFELAEIKDVMA